MFQKEEVLIAAHASTLTRTNQKMVWDLTPQLEIQKLSLSFISNRFLD